MKRTYIYSFLIGGRNSLSAILLAAALLAGCSKALDLEPLDSFSEKSIFSDAATLNLFVNGTYRYLRQPFSADDGLTEGMTDNAYARYVGGQLAYTAGEIVRDNGEGMTRGLWNNAFTAIRRTNSFLEQAATSKIDASILTSLGAEMRFIRAFEYFDLMKFYGGVPIITNTFQLDAKTFDVSRNSIEEVTAFIVKECDEIITVLPGFASAPKGKATKEAAMALKARTLLYAASALFNPSNDQNKWIAARDANKAVMNLPGFNMISNGSDADYYNTFNGKNQTEIIFARYFTPANSQSENTAGEGANFWLYPNSMNAWSGVAPTQDIVDSYEMMNGKLPLEAGSGYDPQNPYVNRDPRFYANFMFNGAIFYDPHTTKMTRALQYYRDKNNPSNPALNGHESRGAAFYADGASPTSYNFKKYTVEGLESRSIGSVTQVNPWIYFRKTEFYLNYAECEIALGNEGPARIAINAVRSKIAGLIPVTESGDALLVRYRRERRVELVLEDHRLHDIRRWKTGPEALNKPVMGVDIYKNGSVMEYNYNFVVDQNRRWVDKMYWAPIPYSEIQRSHNKLTQNPGYQP
ncbi:RagB/SusD family nutrient uptake outer membrane protein [Pedobacter nyackensis]|uniref:RagB/SusD family nutrient uptake outer membrane protein n=1 Tax=Pedobacter nyackensis TaxID=475255 RepID=UPI00292E5FFD|nr:RagB/SusD family nutrient uptake outer membrane protein [Pedobacter nyackensis]